MNNKNKLIPRVRFPEFQNSGEWISYYLKEILKEFNEKVGKDNEENFTIVSVGELGFRFRSEVYKQGTILTKNIKDCKIFPYSSICFGLGSKNLAVDVNNVNESKFCVSPAYNIFKFDDSLLLPKFLRYLIFAKKNKWSSILLIQSSRQGKNIDKKILFNLQIPLPSLAEQQKIAACLSSLDEVITAEQKKLELLNAHKKGLLQNLFPQEGETVPKLRFPEFQNSGEWELKRLGEVFKSFSGGTPDTSKKEYYSGQIPFIRSAEISKEKTELYISELGLRNSSAKMVRKGDLLVALYGANSGDSAIAKIDGAINQAVLCLQSEYSNEFIYHFLTLKKNQIVSKYIQGGQGNLSGEIIKSVAIPFPERKEQQKIAACLSSLDDLIQAQQQRIYLLQQHKKGLLQNLFPILDAE
ncbi:MAG: hypothetical protein OHK0038_26740 [Flammeovirgaceae bacterium]